MTHAESNRLPATWRPIDAHPELRPGPWVPVGGMKGVVFCEACGRIWYLFLDPGQDYYTDVIEMAPELVSIVSQDAGLEDVLPIAVSGDVMLQLMLRDWFALAEYDTSLAAEALVAELAARDLPSRLAVRLLDFLGAVVAASAPHEPVRVRDAGPIADLLTRDDLLALDPTRRASECNEIARLVAGIARSAFGSAYGAGRDRLVTSSESRARLIAAARARRLDPVAPVLAPRGPLPQQDLLEGIEQLVLEIEELLRDGASRVTAEEIAPLIDVVRSFWATGSGEEAPLWDPGLDLYRRCRDLLFALRHANLIPLDNESEVTAALAIPSAAI